MLRLRLILFFLFIPFFGFSQKLDINIFSQFKVKTFVLTPEIGKYDLVVDNNLIRLNKKSIFYVTLKKDSLNIKSLDQDFGNFRNLKFIGTSKVNSFRMKVVSSENVKERIYDNNLTVRIDGDNLMLINNVGLENYVAGVVETEAGITSPIEYYKSQAVICRTYAVANLKRHGDSGFDLCDDVHCQAYKSKCLNSLSILEATSSTLGLVLVDSLSNLITAAFHSNCGGETVCSGDVWQVSLPYLRSVKSDFALNCRNSNWEKSITLDSWITYLNAYGFDIGNISSAESFRFNQPNRKLYYTYGNDSLLLKTIRKDWGLRSTFFSIVPQDGELLLKGKGYGHGVGLCQESAMEMAKLGYTYEKIIGFFYKNTQVVSLRYLQDFNNSYSSSFFDTEQGDDL